MGYDKVVRVSLNERVMEVILKKIRAGELQPGEKLASEKTLCEELGVGRHVLRESLRRLEQMSITKTETGKGTYICEQSPDTLFQQLSPLILIDKLDTKTLMEFRIAIETGGVEIATERITESEIAELEESYVLMCEAAKKGDIPQYVTQNMFFHRTLIIATRNRMFEVIYTSIADLIAHTQTEKDPLPGLSIPIRNHLEIIEAVKARDTQLARERMKNHLIIARDRLEL